MNDEMQELYGKLVPGYGMAATCGGEILRTYGRLHKRFYNDGDHIGIYYGNETCNAAARFLTAKVPEAREIIMDMWGQEDHDAYEALLADLEQVVFDYVIEDPDGVVEDENHEDYLNIECNYRIPEDSRHDFVTFDGDWQDDEPDDYDYDDDDYE